MNDLKQIEAAIKSIEAEINHAIAVAATAGLGDIQPGRIGDLTNDWAALRKMRRWIIEGAVDY